MRVLITNDDGITSPGLTLLANVALEAGHEVIVAAPNREYSGFGAGLAGEEDDFGLRTSTQRPPGLAGHAEAVAVHASPGMIVHAAAVGAFGPKPDVLLSGLNFGPNVGVAVMHSGTVGAALSAAAHGIPAMATSITTREVSYWETARLVVACALDWLTGRSNERRVLNINIPDVPIDKLRGLRVAPLAEFSPVIAATERQYRTWLFSALADLDGPFAENCDAWLLRRGWATASLLRAPTHDGTGLVFPTLPDSLRQ